MRNSSTATRRATCKEKLTKTFKASEFKTQYRAAENFPLSPPAPQKHRGLLARNQTPGGRKRSSFHGTVERALRPSARAHVFAFFFFFFFFYENLQPALPTLMKRVSIVKKAQEKLPALTSWQKYLWVYPPVGLRGVGGWQLLKSVFFVGERSYSLRENTFFASSTVGRKKKSPLYPRLFGGGAVTC